MTRIRTILLAIAGGLLALLGIVYGAFRAGRRKQKEAGHEATEEIRDELETRRAEYRQRLAEINRLHPVPGARERLLALADLVTEYRDIAGKGGRH